MLNSTETKPLVALSIKRNPQKSSNQQAIPIKRIAQLPIEDQTLRAARIIESGKKVQFLAKIYKNPTKIQEHLINSGNNGFFKLKEIPTTQKGINSQNKAQEDELPKSANKDDQTEKNDIELHELKDFGAKQAKQGIALSQFSSAANIQLFEADKNQENLLNSSAQGQKKVDLPGKEQLQQTKKAQVNTEYKAQKQIQVQKPQEASNKDPPSKQDQTIKQAKQLQANNKQQEKKQKVNDPNKPALPIQSPVKSQKSQAASIPPAFVIDPATLAYNMRRIQYNQKKCRFFPNCNKRDCKFFHPKIPCKYFPKCKNAMACMFMHPKCRYGDKCTNVACIFSHPPIPNLKPKVEANGGVSKATEQVAQQILWLRNKKNEEHFRLNFQNRNGKK